MKIKQLYDDFNVDYAEAGHKNVRDGWIGVHCPFCTGKMGYHLGYNMDEDYFACWRCGTHKTRDSLIQILNVDEKTLRTLLQQYGGSDGKPRINLQRDKKPFTLPTNCGPLLPAHKQYLADRGFDPDRLESEWGLMGTGPISSLDGLDYRFRIIAPIQWNGDTVSFQGRDISNRQFAKFKTCPPHVEKIHHKEILYAKMEAWKKVALVVEGITDVWRFGPVAAGTFGIKFKRPQARVIAKSFNRSFILFDPEPQAQWQARVLSDVLNDFGNGHESTVIELKQDPGSMSQDEADYLIKQLIP